MPPQPSFDIATIESHGTLRLVLAGELDIATAPLLDAAIEQAETRHVEAVLVDLAGVSFIDSSGLKALLRAVDRSAAARSGFAIAGPRAQARQLFELSGALDRLPLVD